MKHGKISESVYKRSVLKQLTVKTEEFCQSPGVGTDVCVYHPLGGRCSVTSAATVTGVRKHIGTLAFNRVINRLAAVGAVRRGAWVNLICPDWFTESHLKEVMTELNETAIVLDTAISGVHVESVPEMTYPVLTMSAYGEIAENSCLIPKQIEAGMDIVMTKYAGTEDAVILAYEREEELLKRYTPSFIDRIESLLSTISAVREAFAAVQCGVKAMYTIEEGGVFGALWDMAEAAGLGLEAELRQIPILQETIEVCELFSVNPYQISSAGSMLMVTENGYHLAAELNREGICAKVIGRLTKGKDRVIRNEGERRFLEPPLTGEIWKGLSEE